MEEDKRQALKKSLEDDSALLNKVENILFHDENSRLSDILENEETFSKFRNASLLDSSVLDDETLLPLTNVALSYSKFTNLQILLQKEAAAKNSVEKNIGKESVEKIDVIVKECEGKDFIEDDIINNVVLYHQVRNVAVKCVVKRLEEMYSKPQMTPILNLKTDHSDYNDAVENLKYLVTVSWKEKLAKAEDLGFDLDFLQTILKHWQKNEAKISKNETDSESKNINLKNKSESFKCDQVSTVKSGINQDSLTKNKMAIETKQDNDTKSADLKIYDKRTAECIQDKISVEKITNINFVTGSESKSEDNCPKKSSHTIIEDNTDDLEKVVENLAIKTSDNVIIHIPHEKTNVPEDDTEITFSNNNEPDLNVSTVVENVEQSNNNDDILKEGDQTIEISHTKSQTSSVNSKSKVDIENEDPDDPSSIDDSTHNLNEYARKANQGTKDTKFTRTVAKTNNSEDDPDDPDAIEDNEVTKDGNGGKANQSIKYTTIKSVCATKTAVKNSNNKICCSLCSDKNSSNLDELLRHYSLRHFRDSIEKHYLPSWRGTCDICNKTLTSKPELVMHIGLEHDTVQLDISTVKGGYQCPICKKEFLNEAFYNQHLVGTHFSSQLTKEFISSQYELKCQFCEKEFENKRSILLHIGIDHNKIEPYLNSYKKEESSSSKQLKCKFCDETSDFSLMKVHYMEVHFFADLVSKCVKENLLSEDNACQYCKEITKNEDELAKHLGIKHNKILKFIDSVPAKFVKANFRKGENIECKNGEENLKIKSTKTSVILPKAIAPKDTSANIINEGQLAVALKPKFIKMKPECRPPSISKLSKILDSKASDSEKQPKEFTTSSCKICKSKVALKDTNTHFIMKHFRKLTLSRLQKIQKTSDKTPTDKSTLKCPKQTCLKQLQDQSALMNHFVTQHINTNRKVTHIQPTLFETQNVETELKKLGNNKHEKNKPITHTSKSSEKSNTNKEIEICSTGEVSNMQNIDQLLTSSEDTSPQFMPSSIPSSSPRTSSKPDSQEILAPTSERKPSNLKEKPSPSTIPTSKAPSTFMRKESLMKTSKPTLKSKPSPITSSEHIKSTIPISKSSSSFKQKASSMIMSKPVETKIPSSKPTSTFIQRQHPMDTSTPVPMGASKPASTFKQKNTSTLLNKPASKPMLSPKPEPILPSDEEQKFLCQPCMFTTSLSNRLTPHSQSLGHKFKVIKNYSKSGNESNRMCLFCKEECPQQDIFNHLETDHRVLYILKVSKDGSIEDGNIDRESINNEKELNKQETEIETGQIDSSWFLQLKDFCDARKDSSEVQAFRKSGYKICSSSILEGFLEIVLIQNGHFSKFNEILDGLGEHGISFENKTDIKDLQVVKRYSLFKEYYAICENLGTSLENCNIMQIIIFLSQLLARTDVAREDVKWTVLTISKFHKDVNGRPLKDDKKITDFFQAIGITLGNENSTSTKELVPQENKGRNEKVQFKKVSKIVNIYTNSNSNAITNTIVENEQTLSIGKRKRTFGNNPTGKNIESPNKIRKLDNISIESNHTKVKQNNKKSSAVIKKQDKETKKRIGNANMNEEADKLTPNNNKTNKTDKPTQNSDIKNATDKPTQKSDSNEEIYSYYCLECEGCSGDLSCDHKSHPRHLIGLDITDHFMKLGHLDCRPIGKFMRLGALEDLAYSAQWGDTVRKRWKQMIVAGTVEISKYEELRACKRKACDQIVQDSFAAFKHIRSAHL